MHLDIPDGEFDAYIFDCDGTLVDSMPLHHRAWTAAFEHQGAPFEFTEEIFYELAGVPDLRIVEIMNERFDSRLDGHAVGEKKLTVYMESLHQLQPVAAVAEFARTLAGKKPIAVASGSQMSTVKPSLEHTGLIDMFDVIITAEMVTHGKPAPDIFLLGAEKLGVDPAGCLVFEDGQSGIQAAKAAGMQSVFVPSRNTVRPS